MIDDPEVTPEELILNGVALRPRVNSCKQKGEKKTKVNSTSLKRF